MRRGFLLAAMTALMAGPLYSQDPPPAPAPPPPQAPSREEVDRARREEEQRRAAEERARQEQEAFYNRFVDFLWNTTTPSVREMADRVQNDYATPVLPHDADFDLASIPLDAWLAAGDRDEIPWRVEVGDPILRMDQRTQVSYHVRVRARDLGRLGADLELILISGVSDRAGEWLAAPKVVRETVTEAASRNVDVTFDDSVFVQPGDHVLRLALYETATGRYSVTERRLRVSASDDPLPALTRALPVVEYPRRENSILEFSSGLVLPVRNERPLAVELISALSPPEQWSDRSDILRSHNRETLAALTTLGEMQLAHGSMSVVGLDLVRREVAFEQRDFAVLDRTRLVGALAGANSLAVSADALAGRHENGAFFREFLDARLKADASPERPLRVLIVVSSSTIFERGADLEPLAVEDDCRCRVYHVRFRHIQRDVFDQLERFIRPLRPRTFNVRTARDFRRALAEIVTDLEGL